LAENAVLAVEPDAPDFRRIYVKVGKRDSLASIAQRYKVSVAQIKTWNNLHQDKVANGQSLQIQVPYKAQAKGPTRVAAHAPAHRVAARPAPRKAVASNNKARRS
jgi:membrane-bound lytic murein transglycosylase D